MSCRGLRQAIIPGKTKLVMLESPTNPRMQICDIAALTAIAHEVSPQPFEPYRPSACLGQSLAS